MMIGVIILGGWPGEICGCCHIEPTHVLFVTDGGCLVCATTTSKVILTQTDTRQLEAWSQEDIVLDP